MELDLCRFDPSQLRENVDTLASLAIASYVSEKNHMSPTLKKVANCANLPTGKAYLVEIETPGKIIITGFPGFLQPYPCMDKKWNTYLASPMFTCRKNILFYVEFSSLTFRPEVSWFRSLMIYKLLHTYIPQCLLIRDLVQLPPTRCLHPYSVMFCNSADKKRGRSPG